MSPSLGMSSGTIMISLHSAAVPEDGELTVAFVVTNQMGVDVQVEPGAFHVGEPDSPSAAREGTLTEGGTSSPLPAVLRAGSEGRVGLAFDTATSADSFNLVWQQGGHRRPIHVPCPMRDTPERDCLDRR